MQPYVCMHVVPGKCWKEKQDRKWCNYIKIKKIKQKKWTTSKKSQVPSCLQASVWTMFRPMLAGSRVWSNWSQYSWVWSHQHCCKWRMPHLEGDKNIIHGRSRISFTRKSAWSWQSLLSFFFGMYFQVGVYSYYCASWE